MQPSGFGVRRRSLLDEIEDEAVGVDVVDTELALGDLSYPRLPDTLWPGEYKQRAQTARIVPRGELRDDFHGAQPSK
jgi:hypothetical protein